VAFDLKKNKNTEYFILENSVPTGPYGKSDILQKISEKGLDVDSQIWTNGKWELLRNLDEFKTVVEKHKHKHKWLLVILLFCAVAGVVILYKAYLNGITEINTNKQSQILNKETTTDTTNIIEEKIEASDNISEQIEDTQEKEESVEVLIEEEEKEKLELAEVEKANLNDENKTIETIIKEPNNEIDKTDIPINRKVDKFEKLSNESFLQEIYASNTKRNTSYKNRLSRLIKEVIENNLLDNNSMYSYLCSSKDKLIEDAAYFNLIDALEFKNIMSKKCP
jgi:hypothetical protein